MSRPKKQRLKQRKDGRYCCTYHGVQFMGSTEEEALAKREAYKNGLSAPRSAYTLGSYTAYWLPIHKASVRPSTYNTYVSILTKVISPMANVPLHDLTSDDIAKLFADLNGYSASYIHKARILVAEILDSAADAGYIKTNPARARSIKPPKGPAGTHRAITEEERQAILSVQHRMRLPVLLMLYCGLRRGEVLAVTRSDFKGDSVTISRAVSFVGNQPIVSEPKTAASVRTVPVPKFILDSLPEAGYITGGERPMTEQAFSCAWKSYTKAIGYSIRPHDLRHSYCTWLRDCGIDIHQAIIWMGHADEKMILRIYDHPGASREAEAKNRLNSALSMQNYMQDETGQPENQ